MFRRRMPNSAAAGSAMRRGEGHPPAWRRVRRTDTAANDTPKAAPQVVVIDLAPGCLRHRAQRQCQRLVPARFLANADRIDFMPVILWVSARAGLLHGETGYRPAAVMVNALFGPASTSPALSRSFDALAGERGRHDHLGG